MDKKERESLPLVERAKMEPCSDCPVLAGRACCDDEKPKSFAERVEERLAKSKPLVTKASAVQTQLHTLEFHYAGRKGEARGISVYPDCLFGGETFSAKDSLDGAGTIIDWVFVGCRSQLRLREGVADHYGLSVPTREVMRGLRDGSVEFVNRGRFDTCERALAMTIQVRFVEDCEFRATIVGKRVL